VSKFGATGSIDMTDKGAANLPSRYACLHAEDIKEYRSPLFFLKSSILSDYLQWDRDKKNKLQDDHSSLRLLV